MSDDYASATTRKGALAWTIAARDGGSADVPSDFPSLAPNASFYQPHNARLWAKGTVLTLMDDGQQRPGCMSGGTKDNKHVAIGCYSRALALTIDAVAGTARLLWQFAWPLDAPGDVDAEESEDVLNSDGGTVEYLDNGHALVEFGKLVHGGASNAARDDVHTRVFEVVPDEASGTATAVAEIRVPRAHMKDGQFRVAPRASVAGESAQAPFELELARR